MQNLTKFMSKSAQLVIVFMLLFSAPAVIISILWMRLSVYKACVHSPTYCAIMFILACVGTYAYVLWAADKNKSSESQPRYPGDDIFG
jgi:hypothetical protein